MTTIGLFDSGIGGLTLLSERFHPNVEAMALPTWPVTWPQL